MPSWNLIFSIRYVYIVYTNVAPYAFKTVRLHCICQHGTLCFYDGTFILHMPTWYPMLL